MTTHGTNDPLERWAEELAGDVVIPLDDAQIRSLAASAASTAAATAAGSAGAAAGSAAATTAGATAGVSVAAKVTASVALVAVLGGVGAATGTLPDPIQRWAADIADDVGITLPSPDGLFEGIPGVDLGDVTDGVDVPDATVPGLDTTVPDAADPGEADDVIDSLPGDTTLPGVTVPEATVPDLEDTIDDTVDAP